MERPAIDRRVSTYERHGIPIAWARVAKAKINLALHVLGRETNGYHALDTIVVFAEHGDALSLANGKPTSLKIEGPFGSQVPPDGSNLAIRAFDALRQAIGRPDLGAGELLLFKDLPVAAGLGGGSSDAAAAMILLDQMERLDLTDGMLFEAAGTLGADVPMCLVGRALRARGNGAVVEPLRRLPELNLLLVNPGVAVSTADVFAALENRENPPIAAHVDGFESLDDLLAFLTSSRNDLEATTVALQPEVGQALDVLNGVEDCLFARMSGSGGTCFGIFPSRLAARHAAMRLRRAYPSWWIIPTRAG